MHTYYIHTYIHTYRNVLLLKDLGGGLDAEQMDKFRSGETSATYRNIEFTPGLDLHDKETIMERIFELFDVA